MKLTMLIIIIALGLIIPLYWIIAGFISVISFLFHKVGAIRQEKKTALDPHLGLTMADGGDPVNEKQQAKNSGAQIGNEKSRKEKR
jgi:hypothetical protein